MFEVRKWLQVLDKLCHPKCRDEGCLDHKCRGGGIFSRGGVVGGGVLIHDSPRISPVEVEENSDCPLRCGEPVAGLPTTGFSQSRFPATEHARSHSPIERERGRESSALSNFDFQDGLTILCSMISNTYRTVLSISMNMISNGTIPF